MKRSVIKHTVNLHEVTYKLKVFTYFWTQLQEKINLRIPTEFEFNTFGNITFSNLQDILERFNGYNITLIYGYYIDEETERNLKYIKDFSTKLLAAFLAFRFNKDLNYNNYQALYEEVLRMYQNEHKQINQNMLKLQQNFYIDPNYFMEEDEDEENDEDGCTCDCDVDVDADDTCGCGDCDSCDEDYDYYGY